MGFAEDEMMTAAEESREVPPFDEEDPWVDGILRDTVAHLKYRGDTRKDALFGGRKLPRRFFRPSFEVHDYSLLWGSSNSAQVSSIFLKQFCILYVQY